MNDAARTRLAEGFAARRRHDTEGAYAAIAEAAALAPDDPRTARALAQISYETWRPAAAAFARARALEPGHIDTVRGLALALNAQGSHQEAVTVLKTALAEHPDWIEGHRALATIRTTDGADAAFGDSFASACGARPDNAALRLAWFHALAGARRWDAAEDVLAKAAGDFGATRGVSLATAFFESESPIASRDPAIFEAVADVNDPGLDLARVRFWLRVGEPEKAEAIARARITGPAARMFWPYLSLAWGLLGDARASWLGHTQQSIATIDLGTDRLDELEATLHRLLVLKAPYHEQSVRGGIQTDRHLFFNPDPVIQRYAIMFSDAVRRYIMTLPPPQPGHPLLGQRRDGDVRFEGSWSVLLREQGFHAPHTHMMGWISSAFYIAVPSSKGAQGWLAFGAPPPELGLDLAPFHRIEPARGRLALFPSTMWHGTLPFENGERLSIAFDVAVAQ